MGTRMGALVGNGKLKVLGDLLGLPGDDSGMFGKGFPPAKTSAEITSLSQMMARPAQALGAATGGTLRNTNGVLHEGDELSPLRSRFHRPGPRRLTRQLPSHDPRAAAVVVAG